MKTYKIIIASIITVILLLSTTAATLAAGPSNGTSIYTNVTGPHTLKVGNKTININVNSNKGAYSITTNYPLNGSDSQAVIKAIKAHMANLQSSNGNISPDGYVIGWDRWVSSAWCYNSSAWVWGDNNVYFSHPPNGYGPPQVNATGDLEGYWAGSGTPDSISLVENLTISGTIVTIGWPPSFTSQGNTATYISAPWYNQSFVISSYTGVWAMSYFALYSYTQADESIVRINNTDYRPNSTIYTNWLTGQCTTSPSGQFLHTSG